MAEKNYLEWIKEVKIETEAFYNELLEQATKLGYQMYVRKMRPKKVKTVTLSKKDRKLIRTIFGESPYNAYLDLTTGSVFKVNLANCFYDRYKDGLKAITFLGNSVETLALTAMQVQEMYPGVAWFLMSYINWMDISRPQFWYKCKIIYKEASNG